METKEGNGTSTSVEMGTSDQALVEASKRRRKIAYIIGGIAMAAVIAVTIILVTLLSGNEGTSSGGGETLPIVTTEGPTTAIYTTTPTTTPATTPASTTTEAPPTTEPTTTTEAPTEPPPNVIDLDDIINGVYSPSTFNASWASGNEVLFRGANGELVLYDVDTDTETVIVQNVSEVLQLSSRVTQLSADRTSVVLSYNVIPVYRYSFLANYAVIDVLSNTEVTIAPPGVAVADAYLQNFQWGPSGTACSFVYLNNVYYKSSLTADAVQITNNGAITVLYHGIPDWVYEEEVFGSSNALWFSEDGAKLAYATFDDSEVRVMPVPHYGVPGSLDSQYTQHRQIRYPKPGTTNPTVSVTVRDVVSDASTTYYAPAGLEQPILKTVAFVTNTSVALMWTNRVQDQMLVEICEHGNTVCNQIFTYSQEDGWIDNIPMIFNNAGDSFITILPQSVNNVLYKQVVQVSSGGGAAWAAASRSDTPHTVIDILKWTDDDVVWYKATSVNDSAEQHIFTVDAARNVNCFTCDVRRTDGTDCLYNDAAINEDASRLTVHCAGPGVPQVFVYDSNGNLVRVWESNEELSASLSGVSLPTSLRLTVPAVADGYPDVDVQLTVPADYASRTDVPLLVYVYGGPDSSMVTQQWSLEWSASLASRLGVAVASVDGRGSGLKGVANAFALRRRLGTVEIDDQIAVTRYLQETLPWVDANRTCIWGWSYGGYAASLALARGGDVFRCAAAVAPVADWRFYDTIYTERYMGVPENNTEGYANSSLLTEQVAEAFRSKAYMLIHGTADDNVHYQHAMLLSRLLQRRDVLFTQMTYTDEDHGLSSVRPHLYHGLEKFLTENML